MKATEYQELKTGLDKLTEWSDTLRAVYAKVETPIPVDQREPGGPTTRWTTTDEARKHELFPIRKDILTANQNWIAEVAGMMDSYLDGFVEENQGRADQGRAVTDDGRALFDAMSRFLDATDTPIEGMAGLYQGVRIRCRDWRDRMITWFPDLTTNQADTTNQVATQPSKRAVVVHPNREMLSGFFNDDFKANTQGQQSRFDRFYFAMTTASFTTTEWGRIAHAIKWSHNIITNKVRFQPFTQWLIEFFRAIGVEPPKDTRQNKYAETATVNSRTTQFARVWLR